MVAVQSDGTQLGARGLVRRGGGPEGPPSMVPASAWVVGAVRPNLELRGGPELLKNETRQNKTDTRTPYGRKDDGGTGPACGQPCPGKGKKIKPYLLRRG